jgi:hypothetical protein
VVFACHSQLGWRLATSTNVQQELGGNDHPDEVDKHMVKNIGEGHLLPEMKDCVAKVQNLVTETDGEAWATAFAEVSFHVNSTLLFGSN